MCHGHCSLQEQLHGDGFLFKFGDNTLLMASPTD